jgi:spore germination cell wall hydrolase CwlJ-like protein
MLTELKTMGIVAAVLLGIVTIAVEQQSTAIPTSTTSEDGMEPIDEKLYVDKRLQVSKEDYRCLVKNIYHEAGVEGMEGKLAVAHVTLNRLKTGRWGDSLCSVVHARAQFSWTLSKKLLHATPSGQLWTESKAAADAFLAGVRVRGLEDSMFYHADYIKQPKWAGSMTLAGVVGTHIFYVHPVAPKNKSR